MVEGTRYQDPDGRKAARARLSAMRALANRHHAEYMALLRQARMEEGLHPSPRAWSTNPERRTG